MSRIVRVTSAVLLAGALGCSDDVDDVADAPIDPEPQGNDDGEMVSFEVTITNTSPEASVLDSGVFNTPVGANEPGPVVGGGAYEATFKAGPGSRLSFATMFVQSNDLFYAPAPEGIALFDADGAALEGDITELVQLWDAGTEADEPLGTGENQAPRQSGANTGEADSDPNLRLASETYDDLLAVEDVLQVTLTATNEDTFTLRIENISVGGELVADAPLPIAPGAWALHTDGVSFFTPGQASTPGMEALAEDGSPAELMAELEAALSLSTPLAPGVWAVHTDSSMPLFTDQSEDRGDGLEALAEDGDPAGLAAALQGAGIESGTFAVPEGGNEPGPALPGGGYTLAFEAAPGERLSFATMIVQSNDLFVAPLDGGLSLFDADGSPRSGDITADVFLWDAGTEVNELPGIGLSQAPRQKAPDSGDTEGGLVRMVEGLDYVAVPNVVRVELRVVE